MFGKIFRSNLGGDLQDLQQEAAFTDLRRELLRIVQRESGNEKGRWEGPGAAPSKSMPIDPSRLIPYAQQIIPAQLAHAADTRRDICLELVGVMVQRDIPVDDVNLFLFMVVGTIETWLGHHSEGVRKMASATGGMAHENTAQQHVLNHRWADAEIEFRLALEMCRLAPDGREVVTLIKVADMMRLQNRQSEARQCFREALQLLDRLNPEVDFYDYACNIAGKVKSQLGTYLE